MMEYDFTKSETDTYSDFRNNSFSDMRNAAYSDTRNNIFFQGHPSSSLMTPETMTKAMFIPKLSQNIRSRFMTPKGPNLGLNVRENCPSSARLDLKLGNSRNFHPFVNPNKMNKNFYSMGMFGNLMNQGFGNSTLRREQKTVRQNFNSLGGLEWFGSSKSSPNQKDNLTQKTFLDSVIPEKTKKTLSLKEKYKIKILANKQKNKLKQQKESRETVAPLSTESKTTLEKPGKNETGHHEKTEKKEKEKLRSTTKKKDEKSTAKKKSVIINPNVVVNNFSFKGEPKVNVHEANSFFPKKDEHPNTESFPEESNFSLTNLQENLSREAIEDGKLNIFRVFDHENSSEKASLMEQTDRELKKGIEEYLSLKHESESQETGSKDSFKEFNFKMSSAENNSEENDINETIHGGFRMQRGFMEDSLCEDSLQGFSEQSNEFENESSPDESNYARKIDFERVPNANRQTQINDFLTFHSKKKAFCNF